MKAAAFAGAHVVAAGHVTADTRAGPRAFVDEIRVISWEPDKFHGWPTIARRADGELLLAYSGRLEHGCPFGRLEMMRSKDDGRTWSWPRVIYDSPIDDRDGGIMETAEGSLLITTFTDNAWEQHLEAAEKLPADPSTRSGQGESGAWSAEKLAAWRAVRDGASPEQRRSELGCFMLRSTDGGVTWGTRQRVPLNSPHGPTQLRDGRLLFPGIARWSREQKMGVCESSDDGQTWTWLADIPDRPGDIRFETERRYNYLELSALECDDGKIICQIRNRNQRNKGETLQTESGDGGRTWTEAHPVGVWGSPSHLLRLSDGRLLMTYGHRRRPLGNQARLSSDNGQTWGEPLFISDDGEAGSDLGYPSTVQLPDGSLVTVWYETRPGAPRAQLRQARWRIK